MFFIRHPKPVVDSRPVAVQVVQHNVMREVSRTVLVVETPSAPGLATAPGEREGTRRGAQP